jgi:hypothetical protein
LRLDVLWHDADCCDIRVSAWNGAFTGSAEFLVDVGGLDVGEKLADFPRSPADLHETILAAFGREFAGGAASVKFYCTDQAGHAYLEARIESEAESAGVVQYAIISMPVEPAAIDSFRNELRRLEKDRNGSVILKGRG